MKDPDLRVKAVQFLQAQTKTIKKRPHKLEYSAKHISESVGGYAGSLGRIATLVVADLHALGISCSYAKDKNPKLFIIEVRDA